MKHVIVTGGARGLGLEIVRGLLSGGYTVSTCSRASSQELDALRAGAEGRLFWRTCDIASQDGPGTFFEESLANAGGELYGLVNNAAVAKEGVLATFPDVETEAIIRTNLVGAIKCARLAVRAMLGRDGGGRIVNVSSIIGSRGYTGLAAYSASKAGLDGLTRSLAREVGRRGITVNSVAPGYIETGMSAGLDAAEREQIVRRTPLGRLAVASDVVPAVLFLLGDGAGFVTGQTLTIDGGVTC